MADTEDQPVEEERHQPEEKADAASGGSWFWKNISWLALSASLVMLTASVGFAAYLFLEEEEAVWQPPSEVTLSDGQKAMVRYESGSQAPEFLTGNISLPQAPPKSNEAALAFFEANKDLYQMQDPAQELVPSERIDDELGMTHVRLAQVHEGVPVYGHEMAVHFSPEGNITTVNGDYAPGINVAVQPSRTAEEALESARRDMGVDEISPQSPPPDLAIYARGNEEPALAWHVVVMLDQPLTRMVYFINAGDGKVIFKYDDLQAW